MARNSDSSYEQETQSDSSGDKNMQPRRPHKDGKIIKEEPIRIVELLVCPLATTCFRYQSFFQFCEMVERVRYHHELARKFVINMEDNMIQLAGINFTLSLAIVAEETKMPGVGEIWNKRQNISKQNYEPYIKARYHSQLGRVFPFKFLEDRYVPLMKLIIKYFIVREGSPDSMLIISGCLCILLGLE